MLPNRSVYNSKAFGLLGQQNFALATLRQAFCLALRLPHPWLSPASLRSAGRHL